MYYVPYSPLTSPLFLSVDHHTPETMVPSIWCWPDSKIDGKYNYNFSLHLNVFGIWNYDMNFETTDSCILIQWNTWKGDNQYTVQFNVEKGFTVLPLNFLMYQKEMTCTL